MMLQDEGDGVTTTEF